MENKGINKAAVERAKQLTHKFIFDRKKELNYSNYRIAVNGGMNRQIVDKYERNPLYNITIENYFRICGALNIRPYLVASEEDTNELFFEHFN